MSWGCYDNEATESFTVKQCQQSRATSQIRPKMAASPCGCYYNNADFSSFVLQLCPCRQSPTRRTSWLQMTQPSQTFLLKQTLAPKVRPPAGQMIPPGQMSDHPPRAPAAAPSPRKVELQMSWLFSVCKTFTAIRSGVQTLNRAVNLCSWRSPECQFVFINYNWQK